jgi:ribosome maturation factor RimP
MRAMRDKAHFDEMESREAAIRERNRIEDQERREAMVRFFMF